MSSSGDSPPGRPSSEGRREPPELSPMPAAPPRPSVASVFAGGLIEGVSGTVESIASVARPGNPAAIRRQFADLRSAAAHPRRSAAAVAEAAADAAPELDLSRTIARTAGDMLGTALTMTAGTMAAVAAVRSPYMRTRLAQSIVRGVDPVMPEVLRRAGASRWVATRPVAAVAGTALGAAAMVGGASDREQTAAENRDAHPDISARLAAARLDRLLATPVSRVVRAAPPPPASPESGGDERA